MGRRQKIINLMVSYPKILPCFYDDIKASVPQGHIHRYIDSTRATEISGPAFLSASSK